MEYHKAAKIERNGDPGFLVQTLALNWQWLLPWIAAFAGKLSKKSAVWDGDSIPLCAAIAIFLQSCATLNLEQRHNSLLMLIPPNCLGSVPFPMRLPLGTHLHSNDPAAVCVYSWLSEPFSNMRCPILFCYSNKRSELPSPPPTQLAQHQNPYPRSDNASQTPQWPWLPPSTSPKSCYDPDAVAVSHQQNPTAVPATPWPPLKHVSLHPSRRSAVNCKHGNRRWSRRRSRKTWGFGRSRLVCSSKGSVVLYCGT